MHSLAKQSAAVTPMNPKNGAEVGQVSYDTVAISAENESICPWFVDFMTRFDGKTKRLGKSTRIPPRYSNKHRREIWPLLSLLAFTHFPLLPTRSSKIWWDNSQAQAQIYTRPEMMLSSTKNAARDGNNWTPFLQKKKRRQIAFFPASLNWRTRNVNLSKTS